ncbi:ornithine aminomutase subunit alpha [Clostridiaceae bacterium HSG29]|nr:ornithine aminomutase subunit alpha [Clostridiaceae bacterium HSG29]
MKKLLERDDDFLLRRNHIKNLSDEELKNKFWKLSGEIVDPMIDLARTHTTPSIERSVLIRMGFSSLEAKPLVEMVLDRGLIGKGAGHVVYVVSKEKNMAVRDAGLELLDGKHWDFVLDYFNKRGEK